MPVTRRIVTGLIVLILVASGGTAAGSDRPGPGAGRAPEGVGAPGVGDAYFPYAGNRGYDVTHYDLSVQYDIDGRDLTGTTVIEATATEDLPRFNLDLKRSIGVTELTVDGAAAESKHQRRELVVTPASALQSGDDITMSISYSGIMKRPKDVTGSLYGWIRTDDGAFVANEADGAPTWFPCNDHPTDKATYDLHITVPEGKTAVSNGDLVGSTTSNGWTTWDWHAPDLMATYLVTASIGDFDLTEYTTADGLPMLDAVDRDLDPGADKALARQGEIIEFFEGVLGPYPFTSAGGIIDDNSVGYALETQTRPIYSKEPGVAVVAHELAHQWFGDAVSLHRWRDIWLNEGFATYARWLWGEHLNGRTPADRFDDLYERRPADDRHWRTPPGDPGAPHLFNAAVYWRGAMTLQALREKVGDEAFFTILTTWLAVHDDGDATTLDFIDLAEDVSGQQLDLFFQTWLYEAAKPVDW